MHGESRFLISLALIFFVFVQLGGSLQSIIVADAVHIDPNRAIEGRSFWIDTIEFSRLVYAFKTKPLIAVENLAESSLELYNYISSEIEVSIPLAVLGLRTIDLLIPLNEDETSFIAVGNSSFTKISLNWEDRKIVIEGRFSVPDAKGYSISKDVISVFTSESVVCLSKSSLIPYLSENLYFDIWSIVNDPSIYGINISSLIVRSEGEGRSFFMSELIESTRQHAIDSVANDLEAMNLSVISYSASNTTNSSLSFFRSLEPSDLRRHTRIDIEGALCFGDSIYLVFTLYSSFNLTVTIPQVNYTAVNMSDGSIVNITLYNVSATYTGVLGDTYVKLSGVGRYTHSSRELSVDRYMSSILATGGNDALAIVYTPIANDTSRDVFAQRMLVIDPETSRVADFELSIASSDIEILFANSFLAGFTSSGVFFVLDISKAMAGVELPTPYIYSIPFDSIRLIPLPDGSFFYTIALEGTSVVEYGAIYSTVVSNRIAISVLNASMVDISFDPDRFFNAIAYESSTSVVVEVIGEDVEIVKLSIDTPAPVDVDLFFREFHRRLQAIGSGDLYVPRGSSVVFSVDGVELARYSVVSDTIANLSEILSPRDIDNRADRAEANESRLPSISALYGRLDLDRGAVEIFMKPVVIADVESLLAIDLGSDAQAVALSSNFIAVARPYMISIYSSTGRHLYDIAIPLEDVDDLYFAYGLLIAESSSVRIVIDPSSRNTLLALGSASSLNIDLVARWSGSKIYISDISSREMVILDTRGSIVVYAYPVSRYSALAFLIGELTGLFFVSGDNIYEIQRVEGSEFPTNIVDTIDTVAIELGNRSYIYSSYIGLISTELSGIENIYSFNGVSYTGVVAVIETTSAIYTLQSDGSVIKRFDKVDDREGLSAFGLGILMRDRDALYITDIYGVDRLILKGDISDAEFYRSSLAYVYSGVAYYVPFVYSLGDYIISVRLKEPDIATVYINGTEIVLARGESRSIWLVEDGTYNITAVSPHYSREVYIAEISRNSPSVYIEVELKPIMYSINISIVDVLTREKLYNISIAVEDIERGIVIEANASGVVNLPFGSYRISIIDPEYAPANTSITVPDTGSVELETVKVATRLTITVADSESGQPIPNASVSIRYGDSVEDLVTDDTGEAESVSLYPIGEAVDINIFAEGYRSFTSSISVPTDGYIPITLERIICRLTVSIVDQFNIPASSQIAVIRNDTDEVLFDDLVTGNITLDLPASVYVVKASSQYIGDSTRIVECFEPEMNITFTAFIPVPEIPTETLTIPQQPSGIVIPFIGVEIPSIVLLAILAGSIAVSVVVIIFRVRRR